MSSFAVALPITRDSIDGFTMIKDFQTNYLFQNFGSQTYNLIETKINEQVSLFMPVVRIDQIFFDNQAMDRNILGLAIHYSIPDIGITEMLEFTI